MARADELSFVPLGGIGEIGMNLSLYGLGKGKQRSWLAVDLGVSFGNELLHHLFLKSFDLHEADTNCVA